METMSEPLEPIILVVDDERVVREAYGRVLASEGFSVLKAGDGKEALELMQREDVRVVLCDLKMPELGGLDLLREASAAFPDIPVIVVTGHGSAENIVACMRQGAYYFMQKPVRADHLLQTVRKALAGTQVSAAVNEA